MRVLMVLPALTEATGPFWRPIKYSLFPPLGLATLAGYLHPDDEVRIVDEHVQPEVTLDRPPDPRPDLVVIQAYITNAHRAYRLADYYRGHGVHVAIGGLHPTSLPEESSRHADTVFLGPGEETFPEFVGAFRAGGAEKTLPRYDSRGRPRTLSGVPPIRRDLIDRRLYLVPNSIVVSRGCPHHCDFCYKDAFFGGGRGFYTQRVDAALAEIERLPGKHLYFLDDHLLGDSRFATALFEGMRGMGRLFQGASTVDAILRGDLVERAVGAGLRSVFIGFESLSEEALRGCNKRQNLERSGRRRDYESAIQRLDRLGVMINGSFVFGLDADGPDVFDRTVRWAVESGITTATFHVATPYPGTAYFERIEREGRLLHRRWDLYDTRHAVFRPRGMTGEELEEGYRRAYRDFYSWAYILRASAAHERLAHSIRHAAYSAGWKKFEPAWNAVIRTKQLWAMRPGLEWVLGAADMILRDRAQAGEMAMPAGLQTEATTDEGDGSRSARLTVGGRPAA